MIPYAKQFITRKDVKAVTKVLKSDYLTQGSSTIKFEKKLKNYVNSRFAVSCNSATSALHIACLALGLKKGHVAWTTANTFASTANVIPLCGSNIDLIDIDPQTRNLSIEVLEKKLIIAKKNNLLPKVIITVHLSGFPSNLDELYILKKKYKFKLIEDASHALGAVYKSSKIGSCKYSDITVFSFHPIKIITTAEGGMATTNEENLYNKMLMYRNNGITRNKNKFLNQKKPSWFYEQHVLGLNYRMNEIQAALGISQLKNVDRWVKERNNISEIYDYSFENLPFKLPPRSKGIYSSFHLYSIELKKKFVHLRDYLFEELKRNKISSNIHYIPIYHHPYYKKKGFSKKKFLNTERYYKSTLSLPMFYGLKRDQQKKVINVVKKIF